MHPEPRPGTRISQTRTALLAAGLELVAERPIDAIAVDTIVNAAGVAKGSFFNHFRDKPAFAAALVDEIRREFEAWVDETHAGVDDPLERLASGMATAAAFAVQEPKRVMVLSRTAGGSGLTTHPLTASVSRDLRAAAMAGGLSRVGSRRGALFWSGCCQTLMSAIVAENASAAQGLSLLQDMTRLGLAGLGVGAARVEELTLMQHLPIPARLR